jgi:iron-sulfur cluster repair protein YtfE (RIC family)
MGADQQHNNIAARANASMSGGIPYDSQLVNKLKDDHQELVRIFTDIKQTAQDGQFNRLPGLLNNLKLAFQTHIMLENVKFYVYVQQHCSHDSETSNFISDVRKEMDDIARTVVRFVKLYSSAPLSKDTVGIFNAELDQIGAVLLQRVELEETRLYALYQPKY